MLTFKQFIIEAGLALAGGKGTWVGHGNTFPSFVDHTLTHYGYRNVGSNEGSTVYHRPTGHTVLIHRMGWTHVSPHGKQTSGGNSEALDRHLFKQHGPRPVDEA